jgi:hypothetical protein
MAQQSGDQAARAAAVAAVQGGQTGDRAGAQTEGQAANPHHGHTDSWAAEKKTDGTVKTWKSHTYDDHSKDD